ncbi:MAG: hypothetical protein WBE75_02070 [Candidatus Omnitrophota bacterium]
MVEKVWQMTCYFRLAFRLLIPDAKWRVAINSFIFTAVPLATWGRLGIKGLLFSGLVLFAYTLIAYIYGFTKLAQKKDPPKEDHHYLQELDAKFYGISRKILYLETELFDLGYAISKHSIDMCSTTDKIYSIEHSTSLPSIPEGGKQIDLQCPEQLIDGVRLRPTIISHKHNKLFWKLNFLPSLPSGKRIKYSYTERSPNGAFAMTKKELEARGLLWESFSMRISYPTEDYKHKLIFPAGFEPIEYDYDVWLGEGRVQHVEEIHRIREFWRVGRENDGRMYIEMSIKHPIHGLIYVLKWIPPA